MTNTHLPNILDPRLKIAKANEHLFRGKSSPEFFNKGNELSPKRVKTPWSQNGGPGKLM
jgi:hypothetical protein